MKWNGSLMIAGLLAFAAFGPGCSSSDSGGSGGSSGSGTGGTGVGGAGTGGSGTGGSGTGGSSTGGTGGANTGGAAGSGTGGSSTGGAAGSGSGGAGGASGVASCTTVGTKLHDEATKLSCSSDNSASVEAGCKTLYAASKCISEWEAMANCALSQPEANWECNSSGHADIKSPFCDTQRAALKACTG